MIRIVVDRVFSGDLHYQEMFGLSTDTKPTEGLITGSKFTETDTGDVYLLEEGENAEWHKSAEGPGSGGGGGGGGESDLMLEMTSEQMAAYASDYKFTFTEEQLAEFDFSNPPSKLVFHGSMGSMEMDVIMRLASIENAYGHRLKYGAICGQGDLSQDDEFVNIYVNSFISLIKFDDDAEEAIQGWLAQKYIVADPNVPAEDGTYVLQAVRNGAYPVAVAAVGADPQIKSKKSMLQTRCF